MALLVGRTTEDPSPLAAERQWIKKAAYEVEHTTEAEVVVNLDAVGTIASDDLNHLIRLNAKARREGRKLIVENVQDQVWQVFTVTRLDRLIEIRKSDSPSGRLADPVQATDASMPNP